MAEAVQPSERNLADYAGDVCDQRCGKGDFATGVIIFMLRF